MEGLFAHIELVGNGILKLNLPRPMMAGSEISLCVRPEDFELSRAAPANQPPDGVIFGGRVSAKAFLGNIALYKIACGDRDFQVQTDLSSDPVVAPNDEVFLRVREDRVKVVS